MKRLVVSASLLLSSMALIIQPRLYGQSEGWKASPSVVEKAVQNRSEFIFREENVPGYTLPDPLVAFDGTPVANAEMWRSRRRPEIFRFFETQVYGKSPERPKNMKFKVFDQDLAALNGKAVRKQVTVLVTGKKEGPCMDALLYLPNPITRPVPVFLILNFGGNHTVHSDPAIRLKAQWNWSKEKGAFLQTSTDAERGSAAASYPVDKILSRGYGLVTVYYGDIDPDFDDGFQNGIQPLSYRTGQNKPASDEWGSIGAWAWGMIRVLDYLEKDKDIDAKRVTVMGHSRLGKTALWAGAQDSRFAMVISNNSGCGGAALSRRKFGETIERINTSFPHWFCGNFKQYNAREDEMPVDQHELLALIAPRPLYVASADEDLWADPRGEFLSAAGADPVYRLLAMQGLGTDSMPSLNNPVQEGNIGYHIRTGKHALTEYDWEQYLNFADKRLKSH